MSRLSLWRVLLVTALLLAGSGTADFRKDYPAGVAAAKKGDWAEVRRLMNAALAERPEAVARVIFYGRIPDPDPYVPHYYLGLANAQLGDCANAISAFGNASNRKVIAGRADLAQEQAKQQTRCETLLAQAKPSVTPTTTAAPSLAKADDKPAAATTPVASTPTVAAPATIAPSPTVATTKPALPAQRIAPTLAAIARIDAQITSIERQILAQPLAGTGDARGLNKDLQTLRTQRQQIATRLESARSAGDAALLTRVETEVSTLERGLGTLDDRVKSAVVGLAQAQEARALAQAKQRASDTLVRLDQKLTAARATGIGTAPAFRTAEAQRAGLQRALGNASRSELEAALGTATTAVNALDAAIAAAPKPAPEQLRTLVGWYLAAQYAQVAAWDDLERLPNPRDRAHARLMRASARWHLYMRGGQQDSQLNAAVDRDLREAKRLDRALKPNPQVFSPKLVERFAAL